MRANARVTLKFRVFFVPSTDTMSPWAPFARGFAAKTTRVPFGGVVSYERKFSREHPPFARVCQIPTLHIGQRDISASTEFACMLAEQPEFELVMDLGKARVFRRTADQRLLGEWRTSPYIVRRSKEYQPSSSLLWRIEHTRLLLWLGAHLRVRTRLRRLFGK